MEKLIGKSVTIYSILSICRFYLGVIRYKSKDLQIRDMFFMVYNMAISSISITQNISSFSQ